MGMDSEKLSRRTKQPGHDRTFESSERNFEAALAKILDPAEFEIDSKPDELRKIFDNRFGIIPEASIRHRQTGRVMYFEVKKQGPAGNADERACKHHTVQFQRTLKKVTGAEYHPFCTIFCESLATDERYTVKHPHFFEEGRFFLWVDYDLDDLSAFLSQNILPLLRDDISLSSTESGTRSV
jgi:hypothetical protein